MIITWFVNFFWQTGWWFPDRNIAVEFFKCIYFWVEKRHISTVNISKTIEMDEQHFFSQLKKIVHLTLGWTFPLKIEPIVVYLGALSVMTELSEDTTGASAVLTSAVWCTVTWDCCSSETAAAVSTSITVTIVAVLSACTIGAAMVPGAAVSAVLKSNREDKATPLDHMNTRTK